ncbi:MFS transporter [Parachitinimonas caeni]|uniref:MFS transporter n=1 Tax=Parachitinimonas caeni TaxID=3031301 RepID=A0ABT7E328_9NEIS|nr:MFS transporter [Parachitinimonas caeni]MDK2126721.1 MFS transporter [Parachitinimonas caeni]
MVSEMLMLLSLMVGHVALPWWIVHEGGAHDMALYSGIMSLVSFLALPLLSPLGDRYSKRMLITGGLALYTVESILLALLVQAGHYNIWTLLMLEAIPVIAMAMISPASFSIAAELLPAEKLSDGFAMQRSAGALGRMMGPVIGGVILGIASVAITLWVHVLLLAGAVWAASRIQAPTPKARTSDAHSWLADMKAGIAAKWQIPMERGWTATSFCVMLFFGPGIGMLVPVKIQSLGLSGAWLGGCEAALSCGMLLGMLGGAKFVSERIGRFWASSGAILLEGLSLMLAGYTHTAWLLPLAYFLIGFGIANVQMVGHTHRMLATPENFRSRMTAVNIMVMQIASTLGPAIAGFGLALGNVHQVYLVFGVCVFICGLMYQRVPGYRHFLGLDHEAVKGWYAQQHPHIFSAGAATPAPTHTTVR